MVDLTKIHNELKIILQEFHELCMSRDIKYSLSGGSLLGAIREKGFIPWDDDADVLMERKEYNKLLRILPDKFEIINILWVPRLVYKGASELEGGKSLDIFLIDKAPNNFARQRLKVFGLKFLQGALKENINWKDYNIKGKLLIFGSYSIGRLVSQNRKLLWYEKLAQLDNKYETDYLCPYKNEYYMIGMRVHKRVFSDYILKPFEDLNLMVIGGYDEYLTSNFGNYMKRPPDEKQVPKHNR